MEEVVSAAGYPISDVSCFEHYSHVLLLIRGRPRYRWRGIYYTLLTVL